MSDSDVAKMDEIMSQVEGPDDQPDAIPEVELTAEEEAAMKFTQLLPYVTKIGNAATGRGSLVRVLHAMAEFPLGAGKPRLLNDNERLLFNIMQELQGYKSTLLSVYMQDSLEKQKLLAEASTEGEVNVGTEEKV